MSKQKEGVKIPCARVVGLEDLMSDKNGIEVRVVPSLEIDFTAKDTILSRVL
jgi:hypothetical protein